MSFVLQSAKFSPMILEKSILAFIDDFYYKWLDLDSPDTFNRYK